ncbi:unnamed protein product [Paramecium primaurelia]|uniref:Uncharacterized protein n=1 Tax=Paramecium primaurelia TaxID=5886 RepID=A0A8S1NTG0_PARPR|nr:unnamed protein product [Paramecium primaurelia]
MSQAQDQLSQEFPLIAYQEDNGQIDTFFATLRNLGWSLHLIRKQCSFLQEYMLLLAGMLSTFYLMSFILLVTKSQNYINNENIELHQGLYFGSLAVTIGIGMVAYFFDGSRRFTLNLVYYLTFTFGTAYILGDPLSEVLYEGYYVGEDWIILLYLFTMTLGTYACLILFSFRRQTALNQNGNSFVIYQVIILSISGMMIFLLFIFIMTAPYYIGLLVASFFCHLIYGCLLIIDMKLIISGKVLIQLWKFSLKTNQYVSGALYLYLDITVMVLYFIVCIIYAILKVIGQICKVFCRCCCEFLSHAK